MHNLIDDTFSRRIIQVDKTLTTLVALSLFFHRYWQTCLDWLPLQPMLSNQHDWIAYVGFDQPTDWQRYNSSIMQFPIRKLSGFFMNQTNNNLNESVIRMLEATIKCVGQFGYDRASIKDIAEFAGVSRGLIHYHFKSKEDLLIDSLSYMARDIAQSIQSRIEVSSEGGPSMVLSVLDDLHEFYFSENEKMAFLTAVYSTSLHMDRLKSRLEDYRKEEKRLIEETFRIALGAFLPALAVPFERLVGLVQTCILGLSIGNAFIHDEEEITRRYQDFRSFIEQAISPANTEQNAPLDL